uniref:transposase n=1 Tax=Vibrio parahaemolyticus TaxID=670 RepID=UPI001E4EC1E5
MLALEKFGDKWHAKFPQISRARGTYWSNLNTLFNNPEDIRKAIYTTNAIESLNIRERFECTKRNCCVSATHYQGP